MLSLSTKNSLQGVLSTQSQLGCHNTFWQLINEAPLTSLLHAALIKGSSHWPQVWHAYQAANSAGAQLYEDTCLLLCYKAIEVSSSLAAQIEIL